MSLCLCATEEGCNLKYYSCGDSGQLVLRMPRCRQYLPGNSEQLVLKTVYFYKVIALPTAGHFKKRMRMLCAITEDRINTLFKRIKLVSQSVCVIRRNLIFLINVK